MVIALRGTNSGTGAAGVDVTVALPGGTTANDVVYAFGSLGATIDFDMAMITSGYTELADVYGNGSTRDGNLGVHRKVMGGTPDSNAVFSNPGGSSNGMAAVVRVYSGVNTTTPEDATTTTNNPAGTQIDSPSITTATNGAVVITCGACELFDTTATEPTGYGNPANESINDSFDSLIVTADITKAVAGVEDPGGWTNITSEANDANAAATIALRPASTGGGRLLRGGALLFGGNLIGGKLAA